MTAYELMIKTNHYFIQNPSEDALTAAQKRRIVRELLQARSTPEQRERFYAGVKFPGNRDAHGMRLYPDFYIPPYNDGKKYRTILGQTPKTHIFSANMYELEILRLLYKFAPDDRDVRAMTEAALERLYHTCFGNEDDGVGECFDTNLVVIRFLCTTSPQDLIRIKSRMSVYRHHRAEKPRSWHTDWYYRLCLSEAPYALYGAEIKNTLPDVQSFSDDPAFFPRTSPELRPVLQAIARNLKTRLREYP